MLSAERFHLYVHILHHRVTILVDGKSTHNFIQSHVAKFFNLLASSTPSLHVKVGNGNQLTCYTTCPKVAIIIQGHQFTLDLFQLPLYDAYIVLGV